MAFAEREFMASGRVNDATWETAAALSGISGGARFVVSRIAARMAAKEAVGDGLVYLRTDLNGNLRPYFGQTTEENYLARQIAHAREFPNSRFDFDIVKRGVAKGPALDVAEHNAIQNFTGGVVARRSPLVSNLRDPVGAARRSSFGLPEPY